MFAKRAAGPTSFGVAGKDGQETDPERVLRLKECCDLLLAGGYFRARLQALSPFDRVVGGLVWSITASNMDVDVDIIFQENSTIGQRIRLADSIVAALLKLRCPHRIDPHEIQGLHYDRLFQVIQWLVRKVIETRQLTGDLVRAQSESQFAKDYRLPADRHPQEAREFVREVADHYRPARKFRAREDAQFKTSIARTEATLLEFGEKIYRADTDSAAAPAAGAAAGASSDFSKKRAGLMAKFGEKAGPTPEEKRKREEEERRQRDEAEAKRLAGIQAGLEGVGEGAGAAVSVGGFIRSDEISRYDEELRRQEAELGEQATGARAMQHAFRRQVEVLERQISQQREEVTVARAAADEAAAEKQGRRDDVEQKTAYNERVVAETAKLEEVERNHPKRGLLAQLKALVQLNERLKEQERHFKASCKAQLQELQGLLAGLESGESDEETRRMLEIERIYDADLAKLNKLRVVLAAKNQEVAKIQRAIDDIPTRAELIQYERRFVELYELVAEKLKETRKYYAMYNTLEETNRYAQNEVSLLESISQTFPQSVKTKAGTAHFLTSFDGIVDGVGKSVGAVSDELAKEASARDALADRHKKLLDKQRRYFKAVKEFQEECHKNEQLSARLQQAAAAAAAAAE